MHLSIVSAASAVLFALSSPTSVVAAAPSSQAGLSHRHVLEDPVAPKVAPRGYDVTIVEFADYNCPYCRRLEPAMAALLRADQRIRVVYRDWPIFGGASVEAARASIASQWQGKHAAFHAALMASSGALTSATIRDAARRAAVDWPRLQQDLTQHRAEIDRLLAHTATIASALGLHGTPGLIVGPYLLSGAVDLPTLRELVANARRQPAAADGRR